MKPSVIVIHGLIIVAASLAAKVYAEQPASLRGHEVINETSRVSEMKRYQKDGEVISRDYVQQPPLIPHKIDGYQITAKYNKCLTCHSWNNYKKSGATKISQTHFEDREKKCAGQCVCAPLFLCAMPCATGEHSAAGGKYIQAA